MRLLFEREWIERHRRLLLLMILLLLRILLLMILLLLALLLQRVGFAQQARGEPGSLWLWGLLGWSADTNGRDEGC